MKNVDFYEIFKVISHLAAASSVDVCSEFKRQCGNTNSNIFEINVSFLCDLKVVVDNFLFIIRKRFKVQID